VDLGYVHIDAEDILGSHVEELLGGTGVDKRPYVDVARGDDAVKGCIDVLEADELLDALDVGGGGLDLGAVEMARDEKLSASCLETALSLSRSA